MTNREGCEVLEFNLQQRSKVIKSKSCFPLRGGIWSFKTKWVVVGVEVEVVESEMCKSRSETGSN
jgi:hypothetical protein